MAQLVRAPPCHGGGRRFESDLGRYYGVLAQLGEHLPYKQRVIGSSPIGPIFMSGILKSSLCVCIEAIFFCDNFQILFRTADIDLILANIVPEVCLLIG